MWCGRRIIASLNWHDRRQNVAKNNEPQTRTLIPNPDPNHNRDPKP